MERNWTQPEVFSAQERRWGAAPAAEPAAGEPKPEKPDGAETLPPEPAAPPVYRSADAAPARERRKGRSSPLTTVLAVVFLAAIGYGAVLAGSLDADTAGALEQIARGYLAGRAESGFWGIALNAFLSSLMLAGAVFLCGFSAVGQPFSLFFLLFRGIGLGMSMAHFYLSLEGKGILLSLLLLLPAGALSGYALLLGCRESLRMSNRFFRAMTAGEALSPRGFRIYAAKFGILLLLLGAAALLDAGCSHLCGVFLD